MKSLKDQVTKKVSTNKHKSKVLKRLLPNSPKGNKVFLWEDKPCEKNINSFFKIVHPTNDILKKGVKIEWISKVKKSFEDIKGGYFGHLGSC